MPESPLAQDILTTAKEARKNLAELKQDLQDEINEINFAAFRDNRVMNAEERKRRASRRSSHTEIREAYVVLAYVTLKHLDELDEVKELQAKMNAINDGLSDDLDRLKKIEKYAGTIARITDQFANIVEKAASLAAGMA